MRCRVKLSFPPSAAPLACDTSPPQTYVRRKVYSYLLSYVRFRWLTFLPGDVIIVARQRMELKLHALPSKIIISTCVNEAVEAFLLVKFCIYVQPFGLWHQGGC